MFGVSDRKQLQIGSKSQVLYLGQRNDKSTDMMV